MEDVTDTVFRRIIASCGRPHLFFTEFIHADLVLAPRGNRPGLTPRLEHTRFERPLIAQIWGNRPESYALASHRLRELGFDAIDINMGCPVRKLRRKGSCSGLIRNPGLAAELIHAARASGLPVSVKTRTGLGNHETEAWIGHLLQQKLDALTVHGRYAEQEKDEPADWDQIAMAARMAREISPRTTILGNGDVVSLQDADRRVASYGVDGVMIGRGVFSDPDLFSGEFPAGSGFSSAPAPGKLQLLLRHVRLYRATWGATRNYEILKKFYKIYVRGFPGAEELRDSLNQTSTYEQAIGTVESWLASERSAACR